MIKTSDYNLTMELTKHMLQEIFVLLLDFLKTQPQRNFTPRYVCQKYPSQSLSREPEPEKLSTDDIIDID